MTDLRIYVDVSNRPSVRHSATAACADDPPTQARTPDSCRIGVGLTLEGSNPPAPRLVLFDRQGDHFVLSPQNTAENIQWVTSNQNLPGVLTAVRLTSALIRSLGRASTNSDTMDYFMWLSRHITTGVFRHDGASVTPSSDVDMNEMLIDVFSGSRGRRGMVNLIGTLNVLRREAWLPEEARNRIRSVTAILDLVPTYQAISRRFFSEESIESFGNLSEGQFTNIARIYQFIRRLTVALHQGRTLRFDNTVLQASRAYAEFYRTEIASGTRPEFCAALEAGLREAGTGDPGENFLGQCRQALAWAAVPPDQALRESARQTLTDSAGMQLLQQAIADESRLGNMRIDWLSRRGPYGQVLDAILNRIAVAPGAEGAPARLRFDVANFRSDLRRLTMLTSRGEYDLSALAFLRRLFGRDGEAPAFRVFADGVVGELNWDLSIQDLSQIRSLQASLEGRRRSSADFSQVGMPVMLGGACAVGVGGIVLSQTLPALRANRDAQLATGISASGLAGGGCLGLAGHYVWPVVAPRAVHNRYAWDLGTSAVGSAVGIGTYLLIHFLSGGRPIEPGQRNPVDPFGP